MHLFSTQNIRKPYIGKEWVNLFFQLLLLRKKCQQSELFWSVFSRIMTKYGEIRNISPYSVRMRENADENNS